MTLTGSENIWYIGMDVAIEVFPRSAIVTFGTGMTVVILSVGIIVNFLLYSLVVERDRDSVEACVLLQMGETTEVTSG